MKNIILTGFMTSGKTAVGQMVAKQLNRLFVDMDAVIEETSGMSIPEIFETEGEARFRQIEQHICTELSAHDGLVIATGGGALLDPRNAACFAQNGIIIWLDVSLDVVMKRLSVEEQQKRPMVAQKSPDEIKALYAQRLPQYARFAWRVDSSALTLEETAARVAAISRLQTTTVQTPQGQYPIISGMDARHHIGSILLQQGIKAQTAIGVVANDTVADLYAGQVLQSLRHAGFQAHLCLIPDGETHKTLATVQGLYDQFLQLKLDRSSLIIALGGGVTGDITGFAAATYLRGVPYFQIPTTLLAMEDSSVGGKTGVNLPQGKNLVGVFNQPLGVMIDPAVLRTLPEAEFRSGMAELIKHAVLARPDLFAALLASGQAGTDEWLAGAGCEHILTGLQVKIDVVQTDPYEKDVRMTLNLGHTIGHALEQVSGYTWRHGEAVALGMLAAAMIAEKMGLCTPETVHNIRTVLEAWQLPVQGGTYAVEDLLQALQTDKKKQGRLIHWVLPIRIGCVERNTAVDLDVVRSVLLALGFK